MDVDGGQGGNSDLCSDFIKTYFKESRCDCDVQEWVLLSGVLLKFGRRLMKRNSHRPISGIRIAG
jgi:hypothetical protein